MPQADPGEHADLASHNPAMVEKMRATFDAWFDDVTVRFCQTPAL